MKGIKTIPKVNWVSLIWIAAWIVVFLVSQFGGIYDLLQSKGSSIIGGEYYRLFTGLLLHINLLHLLVNAAAMYYIGSFLGGKINNWVLFVASVLLGTFANGMVCLLRPTGFMEGGSPMTFSLIGIILALQLKRKDLPRLKLGTRCGNWIIGCAVLGNIPVFSDDGSAFLAHMIGLAAGTLVGLVLIGTKGVPRYPADTNMNETAL